MVTHAQINPKINNPVNNDLLDIQGYDRPRALTEELEEDLSPLLELAHRPVISAQQFTREQLIQLLRLAARYEVLPQVNNRPLTGRILISAFYEPSTRTRLSFESAWHRLGGDIMSITDPASTGIAKGETLYDIGEMLNHYGDLVVLRDSNEKAVYEMMDALRIPIVNAGNGMDEHPTQAMADIYALLKWQPTLTQDKPDCRLRIGIVGVPSRMRTIRSLLLFLRLFAAGIKEVIIFSDEETLFTPGQAEELTRSGLNIRHSRTLQNELPELDVVYINAIAWTGDDYEELGLNYQLNANSPLKESAIILHPLARGEELDRSLDTTPHNWYFAQARGAVFVRMALLSAMLKTYS